MPQVDIETLVSVCSGGASTDRKIACETLADDNETDRREPHPDSPPESIWLSKDEESDWWDRNAVYERKESTKGNSSSVPNSTNLNPNANATNSNSQRFSLNFKSKAAILGLPKPQKPSFVDAKNRRHHKTSSTTLFPKRSASVGKSVSSLKEPSSPKVSCMGRVRSKRDRNRRLRNSRRSTASITSDTVAEEKQAKTRRKEKTGFFESFRSIFRSNRKSKKLDKEKTGSESKSVNDTNGTKAVRESVNDASFTESIARSSVSESEPPGLGGMMRFASGRRSESWGVGESEIHVARANATAACSLRARATNQPQSSLLASPASAAGSDRAAVAAGPCVPDNATCCICSLSSFNLDMETIRSKSLEKNKFDAARFSPMWNEIIRNLREEDNITNFETELLLMPINSGDLPLVQWPLFLLASKSICCSLFIKMPPAKPVREMLSFSVFTHYSETVLYSMAELRKKNEDGISILFYLQKIYPTG
ncbi:hypothetical protein RIF29_39719 [Crotalaria pallida]|uniref:Glycosyl transferase 48 domain-containing protein n=1 Tax=Crotalaria pallida TaxID=3830 RepID=A0AAN9HMR4_CROPI